MLLISDCQTTLCKMHTRCVGVGAGCVVVVLVVVFVVGTVVVVVVVVCCGSVVWAGFFFFFFFFFATSLVSTFVGVVAVSVSSMGVGGGCVGFGRIFLTTMYLVIPSPLLTCFNPMSSQSWCISIL